MNAADYGTKPYVVNIEEMTLENKNFRTAKWTGKNLQMTLMHIPVGGDVGLEVHQDTDQFLRVEKGSAKVMMGRAKDKLDFEKTAKEDFAIIVPAGTWHNVINTGKQALKLYSMYAPPHHPHSTVHETQKEALRAEQ